LRQDTFQSQKTKTVAMTILHHQEDLFDTGPSIVYGPYTPTQKDTTYSSEDSTASPSQPVQQERTSNKLQRRRVSFRSSFHHSDQLLNAATAMISAAGSTNVEDNDNDETPRDLVDESQTYIQSQILFELTNTEDQSQTQVAHSTFPGSPPAEDAPQSLQEPSLEPTILPPVTTKRPRGRPKTVVTATSTPKDALPENWSDCMAIYPDASEIATSLQDPGKKVMKIMNGTRQPVTTFPLIQKLCTKIYQSIRTIYNPDGLTKNATRGRESLAATILMARKLQDVTTLDPFFHKFAKNGQVYILTNNPDHSGLDIVIKEFQGSIIDSLRKAKTSRTSNDGLRLALTMLDSKYRESVSTIMTHRKDRKHSDISGDFVLHFFEQLLVESFQNQSYRPPQAARSLFGDIDPEELDNWDPNDPKIFDVERSGEWLLETWKQYVRRKYKAGLDRWNKETGGGNGHAWSFVNYCDKDARWLVAVFLQDKSANFLLASNAGGRMPVHMQLEYGFEQTTEISSLEPSSSADEQQGTTTTTKINKVKRDMDNERLETKKMKSEITTTFSKLSSYCDEKMNKEKDPRKELLDEVIKMNQAINDVESLGTMSPNTRETYVTSLQLERKRLIDNLSKLVRDAAEEPQNKD
jgi:hypothetical protein